MSQNFRPKPELEHTCVPGISYSWETKMDPVDIPINQYQWLVPLPHGLDLGQGVCQELLRKYVWLDVLGLTNDTIRNLDLSNSPMSEPAALNDTEQEEWELDVPTIENIYRVAQGIVRYFNGLFSVFFIFRHTPVSFVHTVTYPQSTPLGGGSPCPPKRGRMQVMSI